MGVIIIGIIFVVVLVVLFPKNKKNDNDITEADDYYAVDYLTDASLKILKVFYDDKELTRGETITITEETPVFFVKGYNLDGREVELKGHKLEWDCRCPVVRFAHKTGLTNIITCSTKGDYKRNISIKYQGGVTFVWKMKFE